MVTGMLEERRRWYWLHACPHGTNCLPESIDELNRYDVIVISDIGSNTFLLQNETFYQLKIKPNALESIKEYVKMAVDYSWLVVTCHLWVLRQKPIIRTPFLLSSASYYAWWRWPGRKARVVFVLRLSHLNILLLTGSQIIRYFWI